MGGSLSLSPHSFPPLTTPSAPFRLSVKVSIDSVQATDSPQIQTNHPNSDPVANPNFRANFRRHTFGPRSMSSGINGSLDANERTGLLNSHRSSFAGLSPHPYTEHGHHHHHPKDNRVWVRWPMHVVHLTWQTLVRDYVNVLLIFVPLGIIAGALEWDSTAIFTLNFFAIVPLASLLSFATEELAATMGQALGGLMNATFGNAVELIVSMPSLLIQLVFSVLGLVSMEANRVPNRSASLH